MLNFKISEFIHSNTAVERKINNMPDINSLDCLLDLIFYLLQPLREKLGRPIIITSGYRCPQLNKAIGGVANSQHTKGQAADIRVNGMRPDDLINFIVKSGLEYDQLIQEYNSWVHISYVKGKNRKQKPFKIS